MSVLVKGMEMPPDCFRCKLSFMSGERLFCSAMKNEEVLRAKIDPNCPLVHVPPHGRLIDADAFEKQNAYFWNRDFINPKYPDTLADLVNAAPTVIEAEGGET